MEGQKRINTVDRIRGLSVLLMIIANVLKPFDGIPPWMKHAHPYGLTFVDFIAPGFFFMIAITYSLSFNKRVEVHEKQAVYRHFRMRALYIFLIGTTLMFIEMVAPFSHGFDVNILQAISLAILVSLPFMALKIPGKMIIGFSIGLGEHILLRYLNGSDYMLKETRAMGVIGWVGLLFLGLALGELFFLCREKNSYRPFWLFSIIYILLGLFLSRWIPLFHSAATLSYNLLTTGTVSILFIITYSLTEDKIPQRGFFCVWGSNPLIAFISHFLLIILCRSLIYLFDISSSFSFVHIIFFFLYLGLMQSLLLLLFRKQILIKAGGK
ncbi:MAG: heparan-alpha-glucosaminide N-acetyltransferase domain-containing protein [Spirochaetales bacterium]|nr:heparan-alpha-glucosaminide N-acetyltransferase domain-containing protein [Spirochaetales bacterium]